MILNEYLKWKSGRGGPLLHSPAIEKFEGKCLTRQLADVLDAAASIGNPLLGTSSGDSADDPVINTASGLDGMDAF